MVKAMHLVVAVVGAFALCAGRPADAYEPTWDSLSQHPIPEWFQDAKFGIYAHLGVYCVPAYGTEWYPRTMYERSNDPNSVFQYHRRTFGDQAQFGYKDLIPKFKLEKFDPAAWAELYAAAGAKFAGPVAEHHDGFSMWASTVNRWNAGAMGPKRDVVGELVREIRQRDMKVVTSFHHGFNFQGYYHAEEWWDTADPEFADLYGKLGDKASHERWLAKLKEVIDAYQPDQIWFDFCLDPVPDAYKQQFAAYYYNKEAEWGKPLIITRKADHLPDGVGVLDIERGRMRDMGAQLWQTDDATAYNSWCWVQGLRVKPTRELLHELIDIVSKNGVLLLNVCPKADGTISDDQQQILREMGQWLKVNGEAIYATRPWEYFGEGPTKMERGGGFLATIEYTPDDIRYTQSKDGKAVYAIALGWPSGPFSLRAVRVQQATAGAAVELLGYEQPIAFSVNADQSLTLTPPDLSSSSRPSQHAFAFKLTGFRLTGNPLYLPNATDLSAEQARLNGDRIALLRRPGRAPRIGRWNSPEASAHWLLRVPEAGDYRVLCEATAEEPSQLRLAGAESDLVFDVPAVQDRDTPAVIDAGTLFFPKAGVFHLILTPADRATWKPVSLWKIQLGSAPTRK